MHVSGSRRVLCVCEERRQRSEHYIIHNESLSRQYEPGNQPLSIHERLSYCTCDQSDIERTAIDDYSIRFIWNLICAQV